MIWYLAMGVALTVWALLLVLAGERQRRLIEIEARRREQLIALEKQLQKEAQQNIPSVG